MQWAGSQSQELAKAHHRGVLPLAALPASPFRAKLRRCLGSERLEEFGISIVGSRLLFKGLFRTKNLDEILAALGDEKHSLKRSLGPLNVTLIGIGAIIGAGIF